MSKAAAPLAQITAGIRLVLEREQKEALKLLGLALKRTESRKYNLVEVGWQLLRLKEITAHGMSGKRNAAKIETETVSVSICTPEGKNKTETVSVLFRGFEEGVQAEFGIEPRSARNYMNAARNAGLTAESTATDVAALRKKKALINTPLAKLYRGSLGEEEPQPTLAEQMQAKRLMAEMKIMHGRAGLLNRVHEDIIQAAIFAELSPEQIDRLWHTFAAATDKIGEHRPHSRKKAA